MCVEPKVALQLYTLRSKLIGLSQISETLSRVAEAGYQYVELAGTSGISPQELKDLLIQSHLKPISIHVSLDRLVSNVDAVIAEALLYGSKTVVVPSLPQSYTGSPDGCRRAARELGLLGQKLRQHGLRLGYHNHVAEFEKFNGKTVFELILGGTDPMDLVAEVDVYWVQAAGGDPAYWLRRLGRRAPMVHAKDMGVKNGEPVFMEVGEGNLNWPEIIDVAKNVGVEWFIVEQDYCYRDPFESIRISKENLSNMGIN